MKTAAKWVAKTVGLRREHIAAARMFGERHALATTHSLRRKLGRKHGRILCYHSVGQPRFGVNDVSPPRFRRQLESALAKGYRFVAPSAIARGNSAEKDLAVTFDDAAKSVFTTAAPVLKDLQIPFALFAVAGWSEQTEDWQRDRLMGWRELEQVLVDGAEIGSHSVTHADFGYLDADQMRDELYGSRRLFEDRLGFAPRSFAIPFGQSNNWPEAATAMAREAGYEVIYAQAEDTRPAGTVPRTFVTRFDDGRIFDALLRGAYDQWEEWV